MNCEEFTNLELDGIVDGVGQNFDEAREQCGDGV